MKFAEVRGDKLHSKDEKEQEEGLGFQVPCMRQGVNDKGIY